MKIPNESTARIKALIFGCRKSQLWTDGQHYDFEKPWDCIRWNARCEVAKIVEAPRRFRRRLADYFCAWAAHLRGDTNVEGFYGIRTNRAGEIADSLRLDLLCIDDKLTIEQADCEEMIVRVDELARLARAEWWHSTFLDWPPQIRESQPTTT